MDNRPDKFHAAVALHQRGHLRQAQALYQEILEDQADHFDALHFLGVIAAQSNDPRRAVDLIGRAVALNPNDPVAYGNLGFAFMDLGDLESALARFDKAVAIDAKYADAQLGRGNALRGLGRSAAALVAYNLAVTARRDFAQAYYNRGSLQSELKNLDAAVNDFTRAIQVRPGFAEAYFSRAMLLHDRKMLDAAVADYDRAIARRTGYVEAYVNRGLALWQLKRYDAAIASYDAALAIQPDNAQAHANRGVILNELNQLEAALASYDRALAIRPFAETFNNRGNALWQLQRYEEAIASYEQARALNPQLKYLPGNCRHNRMQICDWAGIEADSAELYAGIKRGEPVTLPSPLLSLVDSPILQRQAAQIWAQRESPPDRSLGAIPSQSREKLRIGYFSADFRTHPLAILTAGLFESHDRSRHEISCFAFGPDVQDRMTRRIAGAVDRFIDVRAMSDRDVALLARRAGLDIAVDLTGFTKDGRPQIFAFRAAPLQVSYLGYLGTMGVGYMDYLVADSTIISAADQEHYAEKILYLPSYQVNDSKRRIDDRIFTRGELGLPPTGFVFSCFNTNYKITPGTFDGWMRILVRVPGSVLLLFCETEVAKRNLKKEAERRGVDPSRLVFCDRLPHAEYLARYRAADLFLDTLPYNAGATASDALWAGLPLLTCRGSSFASRIAASLLTAVGLTELVTGSQSQYEDLAVALATDESRLARIRQALADQRLTSRLFDTAVFTRHLESGFRSIYDRYRTGLPPGHTYVGAESRG
jgi:predicted O-linked N-acetylglucosamine transferase (SPINDLY family)